MTAQLAVRLAMLEMICGEARFTVILMATFDFPGAITFSLGISLFLLALATAQKGTWWSPLIGIELLGAIAVLGLFVWLERRARFLRLDLALFRIPAFII